jgi:hypothetical protein
MAKPLNRTWHERHRLGSGASLDERVQWHVAHAEACGCRPIPDGIQAEMARRGIRLAK